MTATSPVESFDAPPVWLHGVDAARLPALDRAGRWRRSRGIVIDLDNTLYPRGRYLQSGFAAVASHLAARFGVSGPDAYALLSRCAARGHQATAFQAVCQHFSLGNELVPVLLEVFRAHQPRIFLGHGARELLRGLRAEGWRLVVLTNGLPAVQIKKVEALGLGEFVDHVVYAERIVPGGKPAPAAFREALRCLGTRADRTVCVGDDPHCDIAGARAAGLATIRLVVSEAEVAPELEADIVVETLSEVPRAAASLLEGVTRNVA